MPNHFTVVAVCGRDYEKLEAAGLEDYPAIDLSEINLCAAVKPLPNELGGIVATDPPCRYRNKLTGAFSEGCNGEHGEDWERVVLTHAEQASLREKFGAVTWYDWQCHNWGTKWGTYSHKVYELGGDGSPVLIEFQCAWGPPTREMMGLIDDYLCATHMLKSIKWVGHNPYDNSTCDIAVSKVASHA